ncbi:hypothetical protein CRUP_008484 [Coryphaenoides rupestris]|nr:hypothetical protein CRUP_008484 [Coryphaenoides rupestris]
MRAVDLLLVPVLLLLLALPTTRARYNDDFDDGEDIADFDDNDFAEFEDMSEDDDGVAETETAPPPLRASPSLSMPEEEEDEDEATVELEEEEEEEEEEQDGFEESDNNDQDMYSKYDQEEFEGIGDMDKPGHSMKDPLIIHKTSWESYYMEILMVTGLLAYIMNYIIGKNKNSRLAHTWFNSHRSCWRSNFALVGDERDAKDAVRQPGKLKPRRTSTIYNLWCSGRGCACEGMLIQLKFLKRQDLLKAYLSQE